MGKAFIQNSVITSNYIVGGKLENTNRDNRPGFFAVIPATVRYDRTLPQGAKLLYGEISALCNKKGFCWARNSYFAELYDTSERTVITWIQRLRDAGHVRVSFEFFPDSRKIRNRYISLSVKEPPTPDAVVSKKTSPPGAVVSKKPSPPDTVVVKKTSPPGGEENFRENNTFINNTAATAAPPDNSSGEGQLAAAAAVSAEWLKDALEAVDPGLVFDRGFYARAASHMSENGLDEGYPEWLYGQCEAKKPSSFDGLYFRLFFAENLAGKYRAVRAAAARPPPGLACPACGASHGGGECPSCGLPSPSQDAASLEFHGKLLRLAPGRRAEYLAREEALNLDWRSHGLEKLGEFSAALKKEFGLA